MTRSDFLVRKKAMQRGAITATATFIAVILGLTIFNAFAAAREDHSQPGMSWQLFVGYWAFGLTLFAFPLYGFWYRRYRLPNFGLSCPGCGHSLVGQLSGQIAVATGHCGHCGAAVFDGPNP